MSIGKRARFDVFKRDGFVCQYCGAHPPDVLLEADHIVPVCEGGGDAESNLVTACFDCNRGKAGNSLSSVPKSLAEKAAEIQERESQLLGYRMIVQDQVNRIEDDMWHVADILISDSSKNGMRRDWLQSIKTFNKRLPLHEVVDSAEIALAKKPYSDRQRFLYFCGVCWSKIKEAQA